jgi:alpha-beta hydrolase superfamily lysophospholipase
MKSATLALVSPILALGAASSLASAAAPNSVPPAPAAPFHGQRPHLRSSNNRRVPDNEHAPTLAAAAQARNWLSSAPMASPPVAVDVDLGSNEMKEKRR